MGHIWTEADDALVLAATSWEHYQQLGGTLEPGQVRNRRQRLKEMGHPVPVWGSGRNVKRNADDPDPPPPPPVLPERGDRALDEWYDLIKRLSDVTQLRKTETTTIEWTSPVDGWVGLAFPGDLHIGGVIDYGQLEADLDLIEATEGLWCIGLGDYSNNFQAAAKLLKAMAEDVVPGSEDQMELVAYVMGRTRKWLGILEGNHDGWSGSAGLKALALRLNCAFVSEAGCSLKVSVGSQRYVGYLKHQWKGHSNINTSNESRRMWNEFPEWENADFTVLAHYHQPDTHQKEIKTQTVTHLRGGTYKQHDPYARRHGYVPEYGIPLILLNPDEKEMIPFHARNWRRGVEMLHWLRGEIGP